MDQQDHDLLIELKTMVGTVIQQQNAFMLSSSATTTKLAERISALETKDSRDSEKVRAISEDVRRSLDNQSRIATLETKFNDLKEENDRLRSKANLWDAGNSLGVVVMGILSYFK